MMLSFCTSCSAEEILTNADSLTYPIVDTGVIDFYDHTSQIAEPSEGDAFYGQDATYQTNTPSYEDNGDGTVTDNVTDLMWQQILDEKMTYEEAVEYAEICTLGGYDDWRIPSIKELYSLILFSGEGRGSVAGETLYIDTNYFEQPIGNTAIGEREIDAQTWSSTMYVCTTMMGDETAFGVNFVDGRIKGYPVYQSASNTYQENYVRLVRGNVDYGENNFIDNGDGTITDLSTGLMWQTSDSGVGVDWEEALNYAESLVLADYDDWRLPSVKELQSIVDYECLAQETSILALNIMFEASDIIDLNGEMQYPYYWSSTTHLEGDNASYAAYIAFGEAQGVMNNTLMDVHGAGSQRSDPKAGIEEEYPQSFGPQGDILYVYNYVRAVRTVTD